MQFTSPFRFKLIYVFSIPDAAHRGCVKVGETTCREDVALQLTPNCEALQKAACARINSYTQTAGITYKLLYTELAVFNRNGQLHGFNDVQVHKVLENSGIKRKFFNKSHSANEWFETDVETVKQAIAAVKSGLTYIPAHPDPISENQESNATTEHIPGQIGYHPNENGLGAGAGIGTIAGAEIKNIAGAGRAGTEEIVFRPEQQEALNKTLKWFKGKHGRKMLWNAKMRFGKTLTSLQLVKQLKYTRTLILTHRPVVNDGWFEDFSKIFGTSSEYRYGSKTQGVEIAQLEQAVQADKPGSKYVFFASMQDLRGSSLVGGNFDKNEVLFNIDWNLVIVDEAHEGIRTELGEKVLDELFKKGTNVLYLSGTPFNLRQDFDDEECFTWDYVKEQSAKLTWDQIHQGDHNPYANLPKMKIFTYDLGNVFKNNPQLAGENLTFSFAEFFRVDNSQRFVHEAEVKRFLDLLSSNSGTDLNEPSVRTAYDSGTAFGSSSCSGSDSGPAFGSSSCSGSDSGPCFDSSSSPGARDRVKPCARTQAQAQAQAKSKAKSCSMAQVKSKAKPGQNASANQDSCYPFATPYYRDLFKHTLWVVPGVKEAAALCALLKQTPAFAAYQVLNVAGDGFNHEEAVNALDMVKTAIGETPERTRTITVTCGRLTTGVSVPAWTGVIMLAGSELSSATSYMQTIFRVQTPALINGRWKETCYVFDFAPDRTLRVLATAAQVSAEAGHATPSDQKIVEEFLRFCPVIACEGSKMHRLSVNLMMEQLKRVYVDKVVFHGFEDRLLYSSNLLNLQDEDLGLLEKLEARFNVSGKKSHILDGVLINQNSLNELNSDSNLGSEPNAGSEANVDPTPPDILTPPEVLPEIDPALLELKQRKKLQQKAIQILRAVSIRMPLLIYGAELTGEYREITIDNFEHVIDDESWAEFMPEGLTKAEFARLKHFYDADIFCAAGKRIRSLARAADNLTIEQRILSITNLFSTFRNPDKETVLTPWKVVNDHLGRCLGGYVFNCRDCEDVSQLYAALYAEPELDDRPGGEPATLRLQDMITFDVFGGDARILEINSKSGLYPLYMAYSIFRTKLRAEDYEHMSGERQREIWHDVLSQNIFVICRTPMARAITRRTLAGFSKTRVNVECYPQLIAELKSSDAPFFKRVVQGRTFWKANKDQAMKFNAIVGNPPYQVRDEGNKTSASSIFQYFVEAAIKLNPNYVSMIIPAKWFNDGKGLDSFREQMFGDDRLCKIVDYLDSRDCFPNVDIAGGVCYFLWARNHHGKCEFVQINQGQESVSQRDLSQNFFRLEEATDIVSKVRNITASGQYYHERVSARNPFGLETNVRPLDTGGGAVLCCTMLLKVNACLGLLILCWLLKEKSFCLSGKSC